MEPLIAQLTGLPKKLLAASARTKALIGLALAAVVGLGVVANTAAGGDGYQYAFTGLSNEDGTEAGAVLKNAQIPYRLEAGGTALAVPASKVYDARLLLATAGLPHSSGTGFELFDRGDLGVSEFTQQINLRRATEGELARTISRLGGVRTARVHLTLPERGLFRDDKRTATAAVVINLQPGKMLGERELAGVRHLVASAVPNLNASAVTIVDGQGSVLGSEEGWGENAAGFQRKLERDLESRIIGILEPVVGAGQVVARVSATVDATEVNTVSDVFDPDSAVVKSERIASANQTQDNPGRGGVAGAASNQPLVAPQPTAGGAKGTSNTSDETRSYEVSKTTTHAIARAPRLTRLSVAVLLDGKDGKPRPEAEVARLGELARRAVGMDAKRGDQLDISSAVFTHADDAVVAAPVATAFEKWAVLGAAALGLLILLAGLAVFAFRKKAPAAEPSMLKLKPGMKVSEIEAAAAAPATVNATPAAPVAAIPAPAEPPKALPDPAVALREKARMIASTDPVRTAHLLRAWINGDQPDNTKEAARG